MISFKKKKKDKCKELTDNINKLEIEIKDCEVIKQKYDELKKQYNELSEKLKYTEDKKVAEDKKKVNLQEIQPAGCYNLQNNNVEHKTNLYDSIRNSISDSISDSINGSRIIVNSISELYDIKDTYNGMIAYVYTPFKGTETFMLDYKTWVKI